MDVWEVIVRPLGDCREIIGISSQDRWFIGTDPGNPAASARVLSPSHRDIWRFGADHVSRNAKHQLWVSPIWTWDAWKREDEPTHSAAAGASRSQFSNPVRNAPAQLSLVCPCAKPADYSQIRTLQISEIVLCYGPGRHVLAMEGFICFACVLSLVASFIRF